MTKEITKAHIIQELEDKFSLREFEPEIFSLSERVVPVYNIEPHLTTWKALSTTKSITSQAAFKFFAVPSTERWRLRAYNVVFMSSGAHTVTGLYIRRDPATFLYLDMVLGQTVSYAVNLPQMAVLEPGDELWIYIDSYTSTADLQLWIDYLKEELR